MLSNPIALAFFSSLLVASGQLLLKIGALKFDGKAIWRQYCNAYVIIAYVIIGGASFINIYVFSKLPLSAASSMVALTYIVIVVMGRFLLRERLSIRKSIGIAVTILGMLVYGLGL